LIFISATVNANPPEHLISPPFFSLFAQSLFFCVVFCKSWPFRLSASDYPLVSSIIFPASC